jgi:hypothetical protein
VKMEILDLLDLCSVIDTGDIVGNARRK